MIGGIRPGAGVGDVVVIFSGGLDSTVLLTQFHNAKRVAAIVSFDYGQRHVRELMAARDIVTELGLADRHVVVDIGAKTLMARGSQTGSEPVPEGHYAAESMKVTVVPNRNMVMIALAAAKAMSIGVPWVAFAAHAGDHEIYPDCRAQFVKALDHALALADWSPCGLLAPFVSWSKADIVRQGALVGAPMALTWSCYKGGAKHCGKCGTCVERREAFRLAGVADSTIYED